MAERAHLDWFRERIVHSRGIEPRDPAPLLAWRERQRGSIRFDAQLIGLDEVRDWSRDAKGNVRHKTGQFFGVEGVRIESGNLREVASWDQPIYTQPEGGILALLSARDARGRCPVPAQRQARAGKHRRHPVLADDPEHLVEHPPRARGQAAADGGGADRRARREVCLSRRAQ